MLSRLLFVVSVIASIDAENILFLTPSTNVGTYLYLEAFVKELIALKHSVTCITSYSSKFQNENLTMIVVPALDVQKTYPSKDILLGSYSSQTKQIKRDWNIGLMNSEHVLKNAKVQALIKAKDKKFDLVIADQMNHESLYAFAVKFSCPLVTIASSGYTNAMDLAMGHLTPISFVPHQTLSYVEEPMTFVQRMKNHYVGFYDHFFRDFSYMSSQNKLAQKYFKDEVDGELPSISSIEKSISVMLVNYHRALHLPRPRMPGQIDIGGAHIRPALKLVDAIGAFFNEAKDGVIVFSLGSDLRSDDLPKEKLEEILEAFRGIKQRVVWKFEGEAPKNVPENVKMYKWFSQSSALAHPNVVLFITQGGILSVEESVQRTVPMLFIPFLGQHFQAAKIAEKNGYGMSLPLEELNRETLTKAIERMTSNPDFKSNAVEVAKAFANNPTLPMRESMFWIDYVIKTKGASYMKSSSIGLSRHKHLLIDVAALYFIILATCLLITILIVRFTVRRYRNREQKGKFKYY